MIASLQVALGTLRANPLRTALSMLGIVIGAASLVAVLTLGDGMERFGRQQIAGTTDLQSVVLEPRTAEIIDNQAYPLDDYLVLTRPEADEIQAGIPGAVAAFLTLSGAAPISGAAGLPDSVSVLATLPSQAAALGLAFAAGRYFTADEAAAGAPVVVLSHALGLALGSGDPARALGAAVRVRDTALRVVGVLAARGGGEGRMALVPLELAGAVLAPTPRPRAPSLVLQAGRVEEVQAVRDGVQR